MNDSCALLLPFRTSAEYSFKMRRSTECGRQLFIRSDGAAQSEAGADKVAPAAAPRAGAVCHRDRTEETPKEGGPRKVLKRT